MRWGGQLGLALVAALLLAGIAHLSAVLAIPWLSEEDAVLRLQRGVPAGSTQMTILSEDAGWPPLRDPAAILAGCPYRLDQGPMRVSARTGILFESLSFHARGGVLYFAVTDRAAVRGALDIVVMTKAQQEAAVEEDGDEPSPDVRIVAPHPEGVVIVRVLAGLPSQRAEAEALAKAVSCSTEAPAGG